MPVIIAYKQYMTVILQRFTQIKLEILYTFCYLQYLKISPKVGISRTKCATNSFCTDTKQKMPMLSKMCNQSDAQRLRRASEGPTNTAFLYVLRTKWRDKAE